MSCSKWTTEIYNRHFFTMTLFLPSFPDYLRFPVPCSLNQLSLDTWRYLCSSREYRSCFAFPVVANRWSPVCSSLRSEMFSFLLITQPSVPINVPLCTPNFIVSTAHVLCTFPVSPSALLAGNSVCCWMQFKFAESRAASLYYLWLGWTTRL